MTKQEHIDYWIMNAERDWVRAEKCFEGKDYVYALFFAHLSLEKICKALWVKDNESNYPPMIHNLVSILGNTSIKLSIEDNSFLKEMNTYQLESRYSDYQDKIYKTCTKEFTENTLLKAKNIKQCLLETLLSKS